MGMSKEQVERLAQQEIATFSDQDRRTILDLYGTGIISQMGSQEGYRQIAAKTDQLPEDLSRRLWNAITLVSTEDAIEAAAGTPAQSLVANALVKFFPDIVMDKFAELIELDDAEKKDPENIAVGKIIDEALYKRAIAANPFYYNEMYEEFAENADAEEIESNPYKAVDWSKYSDSDLVAAARFVDAAQVIYALPAIENRTNISDIIAETAFNDPNDALNQASRWLKDKPYRDETISRIIEQKPGLLFDQYDFLKTNAPDVLHSFLAPDKQEKLSKSASDWGGAFLNRYSHYQDEDFVQPLTHLLANTAPEAFFNKYRVTDLKNIEPALLEAVRNRPDLALTRLSPAVSDLHLNGSALSVKEEAKNALQPFLEKSAGNDNFVELQIVRRLNYLHENTDEVRYDSISRLNASGYYQLITEGRSEAYTSTYNHLYSAFTQKMLEEKKGFNDFLNEKPDRLSNLPAFIDGLSTFGQFRNFIGLIGPEEKERLTDTILNNIKEDPANVVAAANYIRNLPHNDPTLALLESRLIQGFAAADGKEKDAYGVLGRWYAENSGHTPSADNMSAFSQFVNNARYQMPDYERVEKSQLFDKSNRHFQMHVFYNDEDGYANYDQFKSRLKKEGWSEKIDEKNLVSHFEKTQGGRQVHIYATIPQHGKGINNNDGIDLIQSEVRKQDGKISFVAHRGHSYHVGNTIGHLNRDAEIVFLGACGGTQFIQATLTNSPNADIIATSGTGTRFVNEPLLANINSRILAGQDVVWDDLKAVTDKIKDARADQYMMPSENMAAVFISKLNSLKTDNTGQDQAPKTGLSATFENAGNATSPASSAPPPVPAPVLHTAQPAMTPS